MLEDYVNSLCLSKTTRKRKTNARWNIQAYTWTDTQTRARTHKQLSLTFGVSVASLFSFAPPRGTESRHFDKLQMLQPVVSWDLLVHLGGRLFAESGQIETTSQDKVGITATVLFVFLIRKGSPCLNPFGNIHGPICRVSMRSPSF